ncbi:MAG: nucleotidyltransferase family protein [Clostridiales bacterium]|nr:nucleotidyltransferase family protein [Clostridiales bacterium]
MKLAAIICEFNPLHTGHKKLIDFAKTQAEKVVCIMSGNFTQRGLPACADKYKRTRHALLAGADLVVELPTVFATASAENFALGGVRIAEKLHADCMVFGSECGDISELNHCVDILLDEETNARIRQEIEKGQNYPKAVAVATGLVTLDKPNNVLAIEYIKALRKLNSNITPITIKREDNYNENRAGEFASSMALRKDSTLREHYTFEFVAEDIDDTVEQKYYDVAPSFLTVANRDQLAQLEGVTEGIHNRIYNADKSRGFAYLLEQVKTKRYTRLKLQRIILNSILGITKDIVKEAKSQPIKIKVLGVRIGNETLLDGIENETDELTQKSDRLYYSLSGNTPQTKLIKVK